MIAALRTLIARWFGPPPDANQPAPHEAATPPPEFLLAHPEHDDNDAHPVPYDENLLERARTQWQFGDWHSLAQVNRDTLQHHPDRAKLALLAAAGRLQIGANAEARQFIRLAQDWGVGKKLISQILIAGVHNSLGRAAAIGSKPQRALQHFENTISIGTPGSDATLLTQARIGEQLSQLGLPTPKGYLKVGASETAAAPAKLPPLNKSIETLTDTLKQQKAEIDVQLNKQADELICVSQSLDDNQDLKVTNTAKNNQYGEGDGLWFSDAPRKLGFEINTIVKRAEGSFVELDWSTLASVLVFESTFGNQALFPGIDSLVRPPIPTAMNCEELLSNTLDDIPRTGHSEHSDRVLYQIYDNLLCAAIEKIPEEVSLVQGLSGGYDSRHILFVLKKLKRKIPRLVTSRHFLGRASEVDVQIAVQLAARLGVPIQIVTQPADRFYVEWEKNIRVGLRGLHHSWALAFADAVNGPEVLLDGMNGGALFGRSKILRSARSKFGTLSPDIETMRNFCLEELFDKPFASVESWLNCPNISKETWTNLRLRFIECFDNYIKYVNPIQAFYYGEHVRNDTFLNTYGIMKNKHVFCPLNTFDLAQFALCLPWKYSTDSDFQKSALEFCYPEYNDIPFLLDGDLMNNNKLIDEECEANSWRRIKELIGDNVKKSAMPKIEESRKGSLQTIQRMTLLAQGIYWDRHKQLPTAEEFFK
jgi:hypothetical protein